MLISGVGAAGAPPPRTEGEAAAGEAPPAGAGKEQRGFALGATAGAAAPDASLPAGRSRSACCDESGRADRRTTPSCWAWWTSRNEVDVKRGDQRRRPAWRGSPACPPGKQTGYAAVIEWHGLRLGTVAVRDARQQAARAPRSARSRAPPIRP